MNQLETEISSEKERQKAEAEADAKPIIQRLKIKVITAHYLRVCKIYSTIGDRPQLISINTRKSREASQE